MRSQLLQVRTGCRKFLERNSAGHDRPAPVEPILAVDYHVWVEKMVENALQMFVSDTAGPGPRQTLRLDVDGQVPLALLHQLLRRRHADDERMRTTPGNVHAAFSRVRSRTTQTASPPAILNGVRAFVRTGGALRPPRPKDKRIEAPESTGRGRRSREETPSETTSDRLPFTNNNSATSPFK